MEVAEFNFDSACTSPFITAPSSPSRFGTPMFSAPTSPNHASAFYNFRCNGTTTTNSTDNHKEDDSDFAFDFSGHLDTCSLPADELFDGGKIKPLKPPPCFQYHSNPPNHLPKSPRSPKKMFKETFSPRCRKKNVDDPFEAAIKNTTMNDDPGRERNHNSWKDSSSFRSHKKTRSLSPFRVSDLLFETKEQQSDSLSNPSDSFFSSLPWFRKWRLKDFLLFRSASEGRTASKAQLNRYAEIKKRRDNSSNNNYEDEDVHSSSFRSSDSSVGLVPRARRRSTSISAHELHYTINRAFSEEMKRKTFLPYKQGWLACLGFNPAEFSSRGNVGSMSRV